VIAESPECGEADQHAESREDKHKRAELKKKLKGIKSEGKLPSNKGQLIEINHEFKLKPDVQTPHHKSTRGS